MIAPPDVVTSRPDGTTSVQRIRGVGDLSWDAARTIAALYAQHQTRTRTQNPGRTGRYADLDRQDTIRQRKAIQDELLIYFPDTSTRRRLNNAARVAAHVRRALNI